MLFYGFVKDCSICNGNNINANKNVTIYRTDTVHNLGKCYALKTYFF